MNTLEVFDYEATHGMQMIIDIHQAVEAAKAESKRRAADKLLPIPKAVIVLSPVEDLAKSTGKRVDQINNLLAVHKTLKDSDIQTAAKEARLSLTVVVDLAKAVFPLRNHKGRNQLIVKLCGMLAGKTADEAKILMVDTVREWAGDSTKRPNTACMHKKVGMDGKRRFVAILSSHIAARIDTVLHSLTERITKDEPELQYDQAYAKAFIQKMLSTTGDQPEQFGPMFMISTDHHFHSDGKITTTDGTLVNLTDLVDEELSPTGWAAVTGTTDDSPTIKLVGAFVKVRHRFASTPQRLAAIIENLVCAWPGCTMPASKCQMHHMHSYKRGGLTTGANLAPLCKQHNGMNDDNPDKRVNGRVERDPITGRPGLSLAPGAPLMFNNHPITAKTIIAHNQHKQKP